MTIVTITDDGARLIVSFPYDADAIAQLKETVPWSYRRYDAQTKRWSVDDAWRNRLTEALTKAGQTVIAAGDEPPPTNPSHYDKGVGGFFGIDDAEDFDFAAQATEILKTVPSIYHGGVFRAMARQLYPDLYKSR